MNEWKKLKRSVRSNYEQEICERYCSNHLSCKIDPRACVTLYANIDSDDDVEYWFDSIVRKISLSWKKVAGDLGIISLKKECENEKCYPLIHDYTEQLELEV